MGSSERSPHRATILYYHRGICTVGAIDLIQEIDVDDLIRSGREFHWGEVIGRIVPRKSDRAREGI